MTKRIGLGATLVAIVFAAGLIAAYAQQETVPKSTTPDTPSTPPSNQQGMTGSGPAPKAAKKKDAKKAPDKKGPAEKAPPDDKAPPAAKAPPDTTAPPPAATAPPPADEVAAALTQMNDRLTNELKAANDRIAKLEADLAALRAAYEAHTHAVPPAPPSGDTVTSPPMPAK